MEQMKSMRNLKSVGTLNFGNNSKNQNYSSSSNTCQPQSGSYSSRSSVGTL
jgi:hypothetical protein